MKFSRFFRVLAFAGRSQNSGVTSQQFVDLVEVTILSLLTQ